MKEIKGWNLESKWIKKKSNIEEKRNNTRREKKKHYRKGKIYYTKNERRKYKEITEFWWKIRSYTKETGISL